MKPLTIVLAFIMILASVLAEARGNFGGSRSGGAHSRGATVGGSHFRGSHFRGGHYRGSHIGVGVFLAAPLLWYGASWYDPYPYGYYPSTVVVPTSPTYIEQGQVQSAPSEASNWWYYCPDSQTYYPYVRQCPGGWQRVAPQPPGQ